MPLPSGTVESAGRKAEVLPRILSETRIRYRREW